MKAKKWDKDFSATFLNLMRGLVTAILVVSVLAMFTAGAGAADIYVPDEYAKIKWAVNNATAGDTIIVRDGTYTENVNVSKRLTIKSENGSDLTIVQAKNYSKHVFKVSVDYVNISGFTVTGAADDHKAGISLINANHCNISDNNVTNNYHGIRLQDSSNNELTNNTANSNSNIGILLWSSCNYNTLTNNTANSNSRYGIYMYSSSNNELTNNTANSNDYCGIRLYSSSNNELTSNTANSNTDSGIFLHNASDNNITCNWVAHNDQVGFYLAAGSTGNNISYNNIMTNGNYNEVTGGWECNFYNEQSDDVVAEHNYWVATENETIDASIYDDEEGKGKVEFYPFETGPVPCAPIPELPTIILLSVGLLALAGYVGLRRKKNK